MGEKGAQSKEKLCFLIPNVKLTYEVSMGVPWTIWSVGGVTL